MWRPEDGTSHASNAAVVLPRHRKEWALRAAARPQRSEDGRAREARLDLYQGHLTYDDAETEV